VRGQRHALATPYPRERPGTHCTGGWVGLRAGLDSCGKSRPNGIRSPDHPAHRQSLYRLRYLAHDHRIWTPNYTCVKIVNPCKSKTNLLLMAFRLSKENFTCHFRTLEELFQKLKMQNIKLISFFYLFFSQIWFVMLALSWCFK